MMKKQLLLDTLRAVEQVEVCFMETLKTIVNINHRYNLVSQLKESANQRQRSYEEEIEAAIVRPTFTKVSGKLKSRKPVKKRNSPKRKRKTKPFDRDEEEEDEDEEVFPSYMSVEANCVCEINNVSNAKALRTYRERIRGLHQAAHGKLMQEATTDSSNRHTKQLAAESESEAESETDAEEAGDTYCCCCACCTCECQYYN